MAEPIDFFGSNLTLRPAPGTEDHVRSMHVYHNGSEYISVWKLTPDELAHVNRTGEVWQSTLGRPPTYISGTPLMEAFDLDTGEPTVYYTDGRHAVDSMRIFAHLHHGDQKYGSVSYGYHLDGVVDFLRSIGASATLLMGGYGHDLEEDCFQDQPLEDRRQLIANYAGSMVEAIIWACTGVPVIDGVKQTRRQKLLQQASKIDVLPVAAYVKVADRWHNMKSCVDFKEASLGHMYAGEIIVFDDLIGKHVVNPVRTQLIQMGISLLTDLELADEFPGVLPELESRLQAYQNA